MLREVWLAIATYDVGLLDDVHTQALSCQQHRSSQPCMQTWGELWRLHGGDDNGAGFSRGRHRR